MFVCVVTCMPRGLRKNGLNDRVLVGKLGKFLLVGSALVGVIFFFLRPCIKAKTTMSQVHVR